MNKRKYVCSTGEIAYTYKNYLLTNHWKDTRKKVAMSANYICSTCKKHTPNKWQVHHLTYERVGNEELSDLLFLCRGCHEKNHNIKPKKEKNIRHIREPIQDKKSKKKKPKEPSMRMHKQQLEKMLRSKLHMLTKKQLITLIIITDDMLSKNKKRIIQ